MAGSAPLAPTSNVFQLDRNRKFVDGNVDTGVKLGAVRDQDVLLAIAQDKPFPNRQIPVTDISLGLDAGHAIKFGSGARSVTFRASTSAFAGLGVYPDPSKLVRDLSPAGNIKAALALAPDGSSSYLVLRWGYGASGSAKGSVALGTGGSVTFSADGKKDKAFAVIRRLPKTAGARSAMANTIQSWMLPRQVASDADLAPGTWIVAEVDGSIAASLGVQFGANFNWVQEAKLGGLTGDIGLRLQLGANAALGFSASGKYAVVVSRDDEDAAGRIVRLRLFKMSTRGWNFALNAGVTVEGDFSRFLPGQFDGFLKAVFGVEGSQIIQDLRVIEQWTDPGQPLSGKLAGLSSDYLQRFLTDVTGMDAATSFDAARGKLLEFLDTWDALPQRVSSLLWGFVETKVDLTPVRAMANLIANSTNKQLADRLAGQLGRVKFFDSPEGKLLQSLTSRGILAALNSRAEFKKAQDRAKLVSKILDQGTLENTLSNLQQQLNKRLKLDQVEKAIQKNDFNAIDQWLQLKLSQFLDDTLNLRRLEQIRKTINLLLAKREQFYHKAVAALSKKYEFSFASTFQSTTARDALLDISFDFAQGGQVSSLLKAALNGDFNKVMGKSVAGVTLHTAALSHGINRQSAVDISLPYFKKSVTRLNNALAKVNALDEEDGRVLLYDLTAGDKLTATVENKMVRESALTVGMTWKGGNGVRTHDPEAISYSYTFRQARRAMKISELQQQVKPYVEKYLPRAFSARADGEVSESFDVWAQALDRQVEEMEGNGPGIFGNTLISLELSVPSTLASAWVNAPLGKPKNYGNMSRRIQAALKELIPFYYFQNPRNYEDLDAAAPLLLYSAIPACAGLSLPGGAIKKINTDKDIHWNWPSTSLRKQMAALPATQAALAGVVSRAFGVLSGRPDLNKTKQFYEGPRAVNRILEACFDATGDGHLRSLLRTEAIIVDRAFTAGSQMAEFQKTSKDEPEQAIAALTKFGSDLTKAFNDNIKSTYGAGALRPLGTLVFVEAARGLAAGQEDARPSALFGLSVLKQTSSFKLTHFANNVSLPRDEVLLQETLVNLAG